MSQPPSADPPYGFKDEPGRPAPRPGKKAPGRPLSESEAKKALADQYLQLGREDADRRAERESAPRRQRTGAAWVENGPLIASGICVVIGLAGLAACAVLDLALPFYILPGILVLLAVVGVVYTWFGLNQ
jgi:hypothetical protein